MVSGEETGPPLLVVVGPTATGKTELGVALSKVLGGEVVSADSMLVYRYMDIGTAKPSPEERGGILHHMIDVVDPDQPYSVALYKAQAEECLRGIYRRGKIPILVGGTGLYVKALVDGFTFGGVGANEEYRQKLHEYAVRYGSGALHRLLSGVDQEAASRLHFNDLKRIIRALEISRGGYNGARASRRPKSMKKYYPYMFGLTMERNKLYQLIEKRVDVMLEKGLVEEVKGLVALGYHRGLASMQALGYKEIIAWMEGEISFDEAVYLIKRDTRRFAKRQFTWFKRDKRIAWLDRDLYGRTEDLVKEITRKLAGVF